MPTAMLLVPLGMPSMTHAATIEQECTSVAGDEEILPKSLAVLPLQSTPQTQRALGRKIDVLHVRVHEHVVLSSGISLEIS